MKSVCFTSKVRRKRLDACRATYVAVWPWKLSAPGESGWTNDSPFVSDDGRLGRSTAAGRRGWWTIEPLSGCRADTGLIRLEEVFHLE